MRRDWQSRYNARAVHDKMIHRTDMKHDYRNNLYARCDSHASSAECKKDRRPLDLHPEVPFLHRTEHTCPCPLKRCAAERPPAEATDQRKSRRLRAAPPHRRKEQRSRLDEIGRMRFRTAEVYLFSPVRRPVDPCSCLWGVVDCMTQGQIRMEILSYGFSEYLLNCTLPEGFRFARMATRDELRDFVYNIAFREGARFGLRSQTEPFARASEASQPCASK